MRGNGERQDAGTFSKADRRGIELGRPDVGVHFGTGELSDLLRFLRTGVAADFHGEGSEPAISRGGGAGNVERRRYRGIGLGVDIVSQSEGCQRTLQQDEGYRFRRELGHGGEHRELRIVNIEICLTDDRSFI